MLFSLLITRYLKAKVMFCYFTLYIYSCDLQQYQCILHSFIYPSRVHAILFIPLHNCVVSFSLGSVLLVLSPSSPSGNKSDITTRRRGHANVYLQPSNSLLSSSAHPHPFPTTSYYTFNKRPTLVLGLTQSTEYHFFAYYTFHTNLSSDTVTVEMYLRGLVECDVSGGK
jgi:hypothetical protein